MKGFAFSASFFVGADALAKVLPFLLIPFLTLNLGVVEYAELSKFYMYSALFLAILNPGLDVYLNRTFVRENSDFYKSALASCIGICTFSFFITMILIQISGLNNVIFYSLLYAFFQSLGLVVISYFQIRVMSLLYFFINVINTVVSTCLTVILFVYCGSLVEYRYESLILGFLISVVLGFFFIFYVNDDPWNISSFWATSVSVLAFCMPLVLHNLSMYFRQYSDKWIVDAYYEPNVLSVFYLAFQLVSVITIVILALNKFLTREVMERIESGRFWRLERKVVLYFFMLLILIEILLYAVPTELYAYFFGGEFSNVGVFIMYMIPGVLSQILYVYYSSPLFYYGDTGKLSLITLISSFISLIYLGIVVYFDAGLSYLAFSYLISTMTTIFFSRVYLKVRYV